MHVTLSLQQHCHTETGRLLTFTSRIVCGHKTTVPMPSVGARDNALIEKRGPTRFHVPCRRSRNHFPPSWRPGERPPRLRARRRPGRDRAA